VSHKRGRKVVGAILWKVPRETHAEVGGADSSNFGLLARFVSYKVQFRLHDIRDQVYVNLMHHLCLVFVLKAGCVGKERPIFRFASSRPLPLPAFQGCSGTNQGQEHIVNMNFIAFGDIDCRKDGAPSLETYDQQMRDSSKLDCGLFSLASRH
jgi:hypothetical protein